MIAAPGPTAKPRCTCGHSWENHGGKFSAACHGYTVRGACSCLDYEARGEPDDYEVRAEG